MLYNKKSDVMILSCPAAWKNPFSRARIFKVIFKKD